MDFAKHGEPVDKLALERIEKHVVEWPDFFEKSHKLMRESPGILGQLYRDISNEEAMEALLQFDYESAILYKYKLDMRIIGQTRN